MSRPLGILIARRVGSEGSPCFLAALALWSLLTATPAEAQRPGGARPTHAMLRLPSCEAPWIDPSELSRHLSIELREHGLERVEDSDQGSLETVRIAIDLASCDEPTQAFLQLRVGERELSQIADISDVAPGNHPRALAILVGGLLTRFLDPKPVVAPADDLPPPSPAVGASKPAAFALSGGAAAVHAFSDPNPRNWLWGGHVGAALDLAPQFQLQTQLDLFGGRAIDALGTINVFVGRLEASIAWVVLRAPVTVEIGLGPWAALVSAKATTTSPSVQALSSLDLAFAAALRARVGIPVGNWLVYAEAGPDLMIRGVELRADTRVPFSLVNLLAHMRIGFRWRPTLRAGSSDASD